VYSLRLKKSVVLEFQTSCLIIRLIQNFYINIIYFVKTYFIIKDILLMIYLFYNYIKFLNKTELSNTIFKSQKRYFFGTEGACSSDGREGVHYINRCLASSRRLLYTEPRRPVHRYSVHVGACRQLAWTTHVCHRRVVSSNSDINVYIGST